MRTVTPIAQGLRERKKRKTRESIQREAMRLFQKQGYEETTIEQIAAAVEVSPSTFFNYFPTKEDVVLYDAYDPMIAALLSGRPADEPLSAAVRAVLESMADVFDRDREVILARAKLWIEVPELQARLWQELERGQAFLAQIVAQRSGRDADDFELRVTVMIVVMAAMEAVREWVRYEGKASFVGYLERAMRIVDAGTRLDAISSRA